jgi:undecaprenyl-diphosphatase
MLLIGAGLLFTGAIQFKRKFGKPKEDTKNGFLVGLAQGFSAIPGISRSGVTTVALLFRGFSPEQAFRLSFILGVPSVFIAEIAFSLAEGPVFEPNIWVAIAAAAVAGYFSVSFLLRAAKKISFAWFCIAFGLLYLALAFI